VIAALIFFSVASCGSPEPPESRRPNIILIITDDQGYGDLGFHGNPDISTPTLDRLARESTRFPHFYVSPVCAPTRASLMTGRYSLRTGVYDTYNGGAIMATEETTVAEVLRDAGYATGIFGKWHLGDAYPFRPQDQGFAESLVHPAGGMGQVGDVYNYFEYDRSYFDPTLLENGQPVRTSGYCSDVFTDAALAFMEAHREQPFFAYVSFNAPHTPLQVPDEALSPYIDLVFDPGRYSEEGGAFPEMSDRDVESARRVYGMVSNIDQNVERIWDRIDLLGLTEHTVIIFLTDNGPQQKRFNGGLRGRKGTVYEGCIRVPFLIHAPSRVPEDHEVDVTAAHLDVMPTLMQLANVPIPETLDLDGHSLLPVIEGESVDWADRPLFFYWRRGMPEPYRNIAVRQGDYKLVGQAGHHATVKDLELFDIRTDPYEQTNLNQAHPGVAARLKRSFDEWYEDVLRSPNLSIQRIQLGAEYENPVILNRNDAKGTRGMWAQERIYGYWDVAVVENAVFDITFHFERSLPAPGEMTLKVGNIQRTLVNEDTTTAVLTMKSVPLVEGDHMFESWYWHRGESYLPFYVEVARN
jgi:arylsulfatase